MSDSVLLNMIVMHLLHAFDAQYWFIWNVDIVKASLIKGAVPE